MRKTEEMEENDRGKSGISGKALKRSTVVLLHGGTVLQNRVTQN
jgi:hypothetical protein